MFVRVLSYRMFFENGVILLNGCDSYFVMYVEKC